MPSAPVDAQAGRRECALTFRLSGQGAETLRVLRLRIVFEHGAYLLNHQEACRHVLCAAHHCAVISVSGMGDCKKLLAQLLARGKEGDRIYCHR